MAAGEDPTWYAKPTRLPARLAEVVSAVAAAAGGGPARAGSGPCRSGPAVWGCGRRLSALARRLVAAARAARPDSSGSTALPDVPGAKADAARRPGSPIRVGCSSAPGSPVRRDAAGGSPPLSPGGRSSWHGRRASRPTPPSPGRCGPPMLMRSRRGNEQLAAAPIGQLAPWEGARLGPRLVVTVRGAAFRQVRTGTCFRSRLGRRAPMPRWWSPARFPARPELGRVRAAASRRRPVRI